MLDQAMTMKAHIYPKAKASPCRNQRMEQLHMMLMAQMVRMMSAMMAAMM